MGSVPVGPPQRGRGDVWVVLFACLLAQVVAGFLLARPGGFWSPDSAVRFMQVQSLLQSHYRDVSVPYPAHALDPQGGYFPIGGWFHFGRMGRFYLSYLPYFSMASAPLYRFFGFPGLLVIPAAAVLGTVWVTHRVLRRRAPTLAAPGALALGLASPLFVYGVVFWDHSLATLLSAGALAILVGESAGEARPRWSRIAAAGVLIGLGFWVRSEMYILAAAAVLGWVYASRRAGPRALVPLIAGIAVPAAGLWALNTRLFGSPFGWKGQDLVATRVGDVARATSGASGAAAWATAKLGNAYYQLASPDFYAFNGEAVIVGVAVALGLVLSGVLLRIGVRRRSRPLTVLGALTLGALATAVVSARTPVSGLLPAAPFVVLGLLPGPTSRWEQFLWAVAVLFSAAVVLTGTHGGLQWGPRYLLPVLPAFVWLSIAAADRVRLNAPALWLPVRAAVIGLIALGICAEASGIDQVRQATIRNAHVNQWVREAPADIVVTPLEWLTLEAGGVYFEKGLMLVKSRDDFRTLVARFSERRVPRWTYIPYSGPAFDPTAVARWTAGLPWQFSPGDDRQHEGLRFVTFVGSPRRPAASYSSPMR